MAVASGDALTALLSAADAIEIAAKVARADIVAISAVRIGYSGYRQTRELRRLYKRRRNTIAEIIASTAKSTPPALVISAPAVVDCRG